MSAGLPLAVVIAAQRAALLRQDAATLQLLLRSWLPVQAKLNDSLTRLLAAIGDDTPTADQLRRMTRYRDLIEQTKTLTDGYAAGALPRITAAQRAATGMAQQHTAALLGPSGARLPVEATNELIAALSDGSPLENLLATFGDDAAKAASQTLIDGLASGRGLRVVASEFRKATGSSAVRAARISRQSILSSYREASLQAYRQNESLLGGWVWLSALQAGRTCGLCIAMHGTIHPLTESFASHVACRCSMVPLVKGAPTRIEAGRDLFAQWSEDDQAKVLGKGKYELFKHGDLSLDHLVGEGTDRRWGQFRYERPLKDFVKR